VIPLVYTWDLAGSQMGHWRSGDRGGYTFDGLTDQGFTAVKMIDEFKDGVWPWESDDVA
jgi:hypothetical protein